MRRSSPVRMNEAPPQPPSGRPFRLWVWRLSFIVTVLAAAMAATILVRWHGGPAHLIATLRDPGGHAATAAVFSPDGKTLAVLGGDGDTYLWDIAAGRWTATLASPQCRGNDAQIRFSPDGKALAVIGSHDGSTCLWDVAARRQVAVLTAPSNRNIGVTGGAFSPDGTTLAIGDSDGSTYVWNVASRRHVATLTDPDVGAASGIYGVEAVAFSPDGKMLAAGDEDDDVYIWNIAARRLVETVNLVEDWNQKKAGVTGVCDSALGMYGADSLAFSRDDTLTVGDGDGCVYLWDSTTGRFITKLTLPMNVLEVNPSYYCGPCDIGGQLNYPPGTPERVNVASSSDGRVLAAGVNLGYGTYLWSHSGASVHQTATLTDPGGDNTGPPALALSPDGTMLAVVDYNGRTYLWRIG
jgi:WD40 repeat protein